MTKNAAAIAKIRANIKNKISSDKDLLALLEEVITEYEKGNPEDLLKNP